MNHPDPESPTLVRKRIKKRISDTPSAILRIDRKICDLAFVQHVLEPDISKNLRIGRVLLSGSEAEASLTVYDKFRK